MLSLNRDLAEFDVLRREMSRLFDHQLPVARRQAAARAPRIELFDRGEALELRAELPGVAEKDVAIQLEPTLLTLRATRRLEAPEGYTLHRRERSSYELGRTFTLPCKVDQEKASASLKDGVLVLSMPKTAEVKPRQIAVKAG